MTFRILLEHIDWKHPWYSHTLISMWESIVHVHAGSKYAFFLYIYSIIDVELEVLKDILFFAFDKSFNRLANDEIYFFNNGHLGLQLFCLESRISYNK